MKRPLFSSAAAGALLATGVACEFPNFSGITWSEDAPALVTQNSDAMTLHGGNAQVAPAGEWLPVAPSVRVTTTTDTDAHAPAGNRVVVWQVVGGEGTTESDTSFTDASGIATMRWRLGTTDPDQRLVAHLVPADGAPLVDAVTFTATARTGVELLYDGASITLQPGCGFDAVLHIRPTSGIGYLLGTVALSVDAPAPLLATLSTQSVTGPVPPNGLSVTARIDAPDDAAAGEYPVTVRAIAGTEQAVATIPTTVVPQSCTPAPPGDVVLHDDFSANTEWQTEARHYRVDTQGTLHPEPTPWSHGATHSVDGGNTGGHRRMMHALPTQTSDFSSLFVDHLFVRDGTVYRYNPAADGPIASIDYGEDRISGAFAVYGTMLVRQGGITYVPVGNLLASTFTDTKWLRVERAGLTAADFVPAPGSPSSAPPRPDFSAAGSPIAFGYVRGNSARFPVTHSHGIDNWRVVIHR